MEREISVSQAQKVIHNFLRLFHHRRSRIHDNAAADAVTRLKALEGICGSCSNVTLRQTHRDGKEVVVVGCRKGHSPLKLYEDVWMDEKANCIDFNENS